MNEIVRRDLLALIDQALFSIERKDTKQLAEISNRIIHDATLFQDSYSIRMAIILYSLSKVLFKDPRFDLLAERLLKRAHTLLYDNRYDAFEGVTHQLYKEIGSLDSRLGHFITEVINQSQIKKGTTMYEHGISLGRTAELMGISQWELLSYIGKTNTPENPEQESFVLKRMGFARGLFGIK